MDDLIIKLHVVFIEDTKIGGYTGYALQFPNVIVEGETKEKLIKSLFNSLNLYCEHVKNENLRFAKNRVNNEDYEIESYELKLKL